MNRITEKNVIRKSTALKLDYYKTPAVERFSCDVSLLANLKANYSPWIPKGIHIRFKLF